MANDNESKQIKPPSTGALIAKVTCGVLFAATGFYDTSQGIANIVTGIIIGLALIAWGILGYKNSQKVWSEHQIASREQELQKVRVCKTCGARSTGSVCEYCGSPLD